jgi:hypothetical protein
VKPFVVVSMLLVAAPAFAQHDHAAMTAAPQKWTWRFDSLATLNINLQERRFTDFHQVESQNWFMLAGVRAAGKTTVTLYSMFSVEPWTLRDLGSAQVFQTGETFERLPLIDYQHPHDLVMALGAHWSGPAGMSSRWSLAASVVGDPALGPPVFMHRASAEANPTAPLGHHTLDSTHITHGVVTAGWTFREITVEGSAFHGREPDEDRVRIEMGAIDSYAARVWWKRGAWALQASGGRLKQPDATEFADLNRFTASAQYTAEPGGRPLAAAFVWGLNYHPELSGDSVREFAWLAEAAWRVRPKDLIYTRAELVDKDILEAGGYDPPGFVHPHPISRVGALTLGYQRELARGRAGRLGLGGDVVVHRTPRNLLEHYGHPVSMHVFLILKSTY